METETEMVQFPSIHPHALKRCDITSVSCNMCGPASKKSYGTEGYKCTTCFHYEVHKECLESPMEIQHPYHPPHPLSLLPCRLHVYQASKICSFCGEDLLGGWVYHCSPCRFSVHMRCAMEPPVLEVDRPKSHDHKLHLLPKPRPFACDACALTLDSSTLPYACLRCGVMLHVSCTDLPRVIRISRHQHRLSYAPSLPPAPAPEAPWSCGVCRRAVDDGYGAYSCGRGCHYVAHTKCATRNDVWDGNDLYGVPEEPDDVEPPYEIIDDNVILHFCHEHHLKLSNEDDGASFGGSEHCRACALPIRFHSGTTYRCTRIDCDFIVHEACANLPRKMWHMVHPHRLKLESIDNRKRGINATYSLCDICGRSFCGFIYQCETGCGFKAHLHCASVSEPLIHSGHPHPLFAPEYFGNSRACSGCKREEYCRKMQCMECDFVLCFRCITLPPKVRYNQDRHNLMLSSGEDAKGTTSTSWWCEICERRMDPEVMHYTCNSCCVTVHSHCILGQDPLMMPGRHTDFMTRNLEIAANISCCRPLCHMCQRRCPFPIIIKQDDVISCSFKCLHDNLNRMG